jgi:hypothetical protein
MADRFDLDAIEADDALLDLLAAGGESARAAGEHDAAVQLLAGLRLAVEVEDELPVETIDDPESFLARCAALNPITDPFARKMATRGLASTATRCRRTRRSSRRWSTRSVRRPASRRKTSTVCR